MMMRLCLCLGMLALTGCNTYLAIGVCLQGQTPEVTQGMGCDCEAAQQDALTACTEAGGTPLGAQCAPQKIPGDCPGAMGSANMQPEPDPVFALAK